MGIGCERREWECKNHFQDISNLQEHICLNLSQTAMCPTTLRISYTVCLIAGNNLFKTCWGPMYIISYDYLTIMTKLRSTYDGCLIYKTSHKESKAVLGYDSLAKS